MIMDPLQMLPLSPESMRLAFSDLPLAICCVSIPDQRIVYSNRAFAACFGFESGELATLSHWLDAHALEEQRAGIREQWARLLSGSHAPALLREEAPAATAKPLQVSLPCKNGVVRTVLQSGVLLANTGMALFSWSDLPSRRQEEHALEARELSSRTLLEHSHELILIAPTGEAVSLVSPAVQEITGWSEQEYLSQQFIETVHPDDRLAVLEVRRRILQEGTRQPLRYRTLLKAGGHRWVGGFAAPYRDTAELNPGFVLTLRDIAKQKEQEDTLAKENVHLAELAQLDELTGIANRRVFKTALNREARRRSRSSQSLALLLLDVDNFKKYNDLYGHLQGDACLRQVAQTLKLALHRVADLVARYGGEEFVMLLPMTEPEGAERVAQNVLKSVAALRIPHAATPAGIVTVSIGVSTWPASREMDEERLIEEADRALYRAKNQGRNMYCVSHLPSEGFA